MVVPDLREAARLGSRPGLGPPTHWAPRPPTRSPLQPPPLAAKKKPHKSWRGTDRRERVQETEKGERDLGGWTETGRIRKTDEKREMGVETETGEGESDERPLMAETKLGQGGERERKKTGEDGRESRRQKRGRNWRERQEGEASGGGEADGGERRWGHPFPPPQGSGEEARGLRPRLGLRAETGRG